MNKYYFTFGFGQDNSDRYQLIIASNEYDAAKKMFEIYGKQWAFQYTREQWEKSLADGRFHSLRALPTISAEEVTA